jgi:glycyl-tRNA synthetase beta chain
VPETLLLEIGCEEIPAGYIAPALEQLGRAASEGLATARIAHGAVRTLGTPRRLTLIVESVAALQEDRTREVTGPPAKAAFDAAGAPTQAARGFAKNAGVAVEALERVQTPKGEYLLARVHEKGAASAAVLPGLLRGWIEGLQFPRTMHWNSGGRFARPVRWLVALLGADVLPLEVFGVAAGRRSRGHRILAPGWFEIASPADYAGALRERAVLVDPDERRGAVATTLEAAARALGGRAIPDPGLLEEVTHLVEWPEAVAGHFDEKYLRLPRPVIVTAMRSHQRYFAAEDAGGRLLPYFLAIRNGRGEGADGIRRGNELVLRARLEDARFYWEKDTRTPLEAKVPELRGIVWHEKLGSVYDRTRRLVKIVERLAATLAPASRQTASRAAYLCKADLASEMIRDGKEFTTLQGIIGAEYAAAAGEPPAVVHAIREHHLPQGPGDPLPGSTEGLLLSLADKLDSIVGGFHAGLEVSGSQDPYGLRRAGNGVVRILLERRLPLDVVEGAGWIDSTYDNAGSSGSISELFGEFWAGRLATALEEQGISRETANAVLAVRPGSPLDVVARARALEEVRQSPDFEGLMIGYRRAANLLRTAAPEDLPPPGQPLAGPGAEFADKPEADLHLETNLARQAVESHLESDDPDYAAVLRRLLGLKPSIDRFFESVMVMVDDTPTRRRRLGLLEAVRRTFLRIADFSALPNAPGQKSV